MSRFFPLKFKSSRTPKIIEKHGYKIIDNFSYLENDQDPLVKSRIAQENKRVLDFQKKSKFFTPLRKEISLLQKRMEKRNTSTPPERNGNYFYFSRNKGDLPFPLLCRKSIFNQIEQVIFDPNKLCEGKDGFLHIGMEKISFDGKFLAYTYDMVGNEKFNAAVINLETDEVIKVPCDGNIMSVEWAYLNPSNPMLLFTTMNSKMRANKVFAFNLSSPPTLIFKEDSFYVDVIRSKDNKYVFVTLNSKTTSEVWSLDLSNNVDLKLLLVSARQEGLQYFVEHRKGEFIIVTNLKHRLNFGIMKVSTEFPSINNWRDVLSTDPKFTISEIDVLEKGIVVYYSQSIVSFYSFELMKAEKIPIPEQFMYGEICGGINPYETNSVRLIISSLLHDETHFDLDISSQIIRISLANSGFKFDDLFSDKFQVTRIHVVSGENSIPLTLVHLKNVLLDSSNPVLLHVYGAYGMKLELSFDCTRYSLLNKGWIFAFAGVRGGNECGLKWYHDGRGMLKHNSVDDLNVCAQYLINNKWSQPSLMNLHSYSAGGLVLAAHLNRFGNSVFSSVIAKMPFVDLIGNMVNENLPLTEIEYSEWGNPDDKSTFQYWMTLCPFLNVGNTHYPNIFTTGAISDPRVPFYDPLKWITKIKEQSSNSSLLLIEINDIGHFGDLSLNGIATTKAMEYSFLLETTNSAIKHPFSDL